MQFTRACRRVAAVAAATTLLAGCSSGSGGASAGGPVRVVAAINVWGDIAAQIGGSGARVTSIISKASVDPHEYEPDVRDAAAVDKARVVIENGASYDDFLGKLVSAGHRSDLAVVNVAEVVGAGGGANPHLWYSPDYVVQAARAIEARLAAAAARSRGDVRGQPVRRSWPARRTVSAVIATIKARHGGQAVAYTEPLPGYLVAAAGLHLGTPAGFSKALEDGTDPSPADSVAFERALADHTVKVLIYNSQVTDPETTRLRAVAARAGVPVVPMTETLPRGLSFQAWQAVEASALLAALDQS